MCGGEGAFQGEWLALKALREKGMDIADRLHAASQAPDADLGEIATRFARVSRAVRQTIFLEARLAEEARRRSAAAAPANDPFALPWWVDMRVMVAEGRQKDADRKLEVTRLVRRVMDRAEVCDRERLEDELNFRLDKPAFADTQLDEPDLIAAICRDMGLAPDWRGFSKRDWWGAKPETREALLSGERGHDTYPQRPPEQIDVPEPGIGIVSPVPDRRRSPPPTSWM
ncbi:MAG: hypothetical protein JWO33_2450 [Caulobacteraceae bacterium]|nr:hypothetical protein [Caulobacteraceae bacterium]